MSDRREELTNALRHLLEMTNAREVHREIRLLLLKMESAPARDGTETMKLTDVYQSSDVPRTIRACCGSFGNKHRKHCEKHVPGTWKKRPDTSNDPMRCAACREHINHDNSGASHRNDCPFYQPTQHSRIPVRAETILNFLCMDCGSNFCTNLAKIDAQCPRCRGVHLTDRPDPQVRIIKL